MESNRVSCYFPYFNRKNIEYYKNNLNKEKNLI